MDPRHLQRLKEEQDKAIADTNHQLYEWNKFRSDYLALKERLTSLPQKTSHEVMVPFGSLAFMPGQLVHTNEILALLGDNYFLERSAFQASEIVSRRLEELDKNIKSLEKQRELLIPRSQFTSDFMQDAEGTEQQEIVEPYDEEAEAVWRTHHKEYLRKAGKKHQRERLEKNGAKKKVAQSDGELWERLEQLELQEQRRGELLQSEEDESPCLLNSESNASTDASRQNHEQVRVHDPSSTSEDSTEDSDTADTRPVQRVIHFTHSKQFDDKSSSAVSKEAEEHSKDASTTINTPADIYNIFRSSPSSILKKSHTDRKGKSVINEDKQRVTFSSSATQKEEKAELQSDVHTKTKDFDASGDAKPKSCAAKAFNNMVVETKPQCLPTFPDLVDQQPGTSSSSATKNNSSSSRPLSKFQRARQGKT